MAKLWPFEVYMLFKWICEFLHLNFNLKIGFIASAEERGARTGSTGVGPTRQPHGPRWTGCTRLTPAGAVGPTRQPHPRTRAADGRAPHGSRGARPKAASPAQPTGGGAPAPRWSPAAAIGTAERRPREGRGGGNEMGGPRLTPVRRRRRKRRPERRKAAARLG